MYISVIKDCLVSHYICLDDNGITTCVCVCVCVCENSGLLARQC